jgi:hypothetical protein
MKNFFLIVSLLSAFRGDCDTVLSPFVVPNSSLGIPFTTDQNSAQSVRYQQVYGASDFMTVCNRVSCSPNSAPLLITAISFGLATNSAGLTAFLPNVRIDFSTTQKAPDSLSPVFSDNIGAGDQVVYSGSWNAATGLLQLQQPFLYDPSLGNLLMDVRNFQTTVPNPMGIMRFEAVNTLGDSTSIAIGPDVNATSGGLASIGLSTRFTVTPVPEPNAALLLLIAIVPAWFFRWRKRGRREANS